MREREQFERLWSMFYRGSVYEALVAAGVTNEQMRIICEVLRDQQVQKFNKKREELTKQITRMEAEEIK